MSDGDNGRKSLFTRRAAAKATFKVVVGTAAAVLAAAKAEAGYGRCSKCNCPAYEGNGNICDNCGHNYKAHW